MRYYTGTNWFIIIYMQIRSNLFVSNQFTGCRLFVWRTCRHSRQVTSIALWQPRQRRQETAVNDIWMTFFARIPAAFSCNLETCQRLMQLAHLFASQKVCLSFADAFPARRRWTSPPHQGKGRQPKWRSRLIWAQLFCLIERAMAEIFTSATQPLWQSGWRSHSVTTEWLSGCSRDCGRVAAEWLSGCSSHSGSDCGRMAEWLSGCVSHSGTVAEWLLPQLWQSGWVAIWVTLAEWLSGCSSHSGSDCGRMAEWLRQSLWQCGWVAE